MDNLFSANNKQRRHKRVTEAKAGNAVCACGTTAVGFSSGGPVCARCKAIESKLATQYMKQKVGFSRKSSWSDETLLGDAV